MKIISLLNCLDKIIDCRGKTPKKLNSEWLNSKKGYRAISANNVKFDGLEKLDKINYGDEKLYKKWMKDEVKRNDLLLTSEAPAGQVMLWSSDEKIILSQRLFALRVNSKFDSKYLKYYLQSKTGQKEIIRNTSGSTVFGISAKMFSRINVIYKDKPIQELIGNNLYNLDKKIELNNQINHKLEAMAKTLYDYWFVQFDFPDAEGKPYKNSGGKMVYSGELKREIPEGWKDGKLEDFSSIISGSTPSKSKPKNFSCNGTPWITPKDLSLNVGNKFITKGAIDVSQVGLESTSLRKLPKGTILLSSRAPIGYMAIARNIMTTNQGFKSFIPKEGYSSQFIFYTLKSIMKLIEKNASGSTFKEISSSVIKELKIVLPPCEFIALYSQNVQAIFDRQDLLEQENQKLTQLRDWLLPMLMNGQVKVGDVAHTSEELMVAEPSMGYGESR